MIELRAVVAATGQRPLTAVLRGAEVVRIEGPARAVSALLDVIAGRRAPRSGDVAWRGGGGAAVVVRAGERMPAGVDEDDAIAAWAALAGGAASDDATAATKATDASDAEGAAARGHTLAAPVWLVDGALDEADERLVRTAAEQVRAGQGLMVWSARGDAARGAVDRVIVLEVDDDAGEAPPVARRRAPAPRAAGAIPWAAIGRFAAAAVGSRGAVAIGAVAALWLAVCAATVGVHEGFWFADGSAVGLALIARLGAIGAATVAAVATAVRTEAAAAWPAMLRETGARAAARTLVLVAGDLGGAVVAGGVAALPAVWAADASGAFAGAVVTIGAAGVAGAVTRLARGRAGGAMLGSLAGAGGALALLW